MACRMALTGLAFTDHMDVAAAAEGVRLSTETGMRFFSGVEMSTVSGDAEYHLLLYGFHPDDVGLKAFLRDTCRFIWERTLDALHIFVRMGFDIQQRDIDGWGFSVPTGVTLLKALLKRNRGDRRLQEYLVGSKASSPYLNFYRDYAVDDIGEIVREALPDLMETMRSFRDRGILVLAHPGDTDRALLVKLKEEGLRGIEVYSTHHSQRETNRLLEIARSLELWVSAGSDFHGELIKPGIAIGDCAGQPDKGFMEALALFSD